MGFLSLPPSNFRVKAGNPMLVAPYYGKSAYQPITQEFVLSLPFRGVVGTNATYFEIALPNFEDYKDPETPPDMFPDVISPQEYGYFAYPVSFGKTQFLDSDNGFYGGWDGAKYTENNGVYNPPENWDDPPIMGAVIIDVNVPGIGTVPMYVYRTDRFDLGLLRFTAQKDDGSGYAS